MSLPILNAFGSLNGAGTKASAARHSYPELHDAVWMTTHAHMSAHEVAALLGCSSWHVWAMRRHHGPLQQPQSPGTARAKIRERLRGAS
jgi:hypothetical protein